MPQALRTADAVAADSAYNSAAPGVEVLPAFLAEDQEENPDEEPDQPAEIAPV